MEFLNQFFTGLEGTLLQIPHMPAFVANLEIANHEDLATTTAKIAEVNFEEGYENSEGEVVEETEQE